MADHQIRASDQDREDAAFMLAEAYAAGRLSHDELGQRLTAVYAASTCGKLRALTADLPAGPRCPAYRQPSSGRGRPLAREPHVARVRLITQLSAIMIVATLIGLTGLAIPAAMWLAALLIPAVLLLLPAIGSNAALQQQRQNAMEACPGTGVHRPRPAGLPCRRCRPAGPRGVPAPDRGCHARRTARRPRAPGGTGSRPGRLE